MHRHNVYRFCPRCGGELERRQVKQGEPERLVCSRCGFIFYLDPKVAACAVIEIDGGIVMVRRAISPAVGKWVIPGGFVDVGEPVPEAARREVEEETTLTVTIGSLIGVYSYSDSSVVVVVYEATRMGGTITAGDETLEACLFPLSGIPWDEIPFSSTRDALRDYLYRHHPEIIRRN